MDGLQIPLPKDCRYLLHISTDGFSSHGGGMVHYFEDEQIVTCQDESIILGRDNNSYKMSKDGQELVEMPIKTPPHYLNSIFPLNDQLYFLSSANELYVVEDNLLQQVIDEVPMFSFLTNVQFQAQVIISWYAGVNYFYIISEGQTQIIQFKENQYDPNSIITLNISANLLYNFQNIAIFDDYRLLDVNTQIFYKNIKQFGLELPEKLIPREVGWIVDYDYLESLYEDVIEAEMNTDKLLEDYYASKLKTNERQEKHDVDE